MNAATKPLSSPEHIPHPPIEPLLASIATPLRWKILATLAAGQPLMVKEIANKLSHKPSIISKHLALMRKAGAVEIGHGRLYQIPNHFLIAADKRHVDFGHCLLRLPVLAARLAAAPA